MLLDSMVGRLERDITYREAMWNMERTQTSQIIETIQQSEYVSVDTARLVDEKKALSIQLEAAQRALQTALSEKEDDLRNQKAQNAELQDKLRLLQADESNKVQLAAVTQEKDDVTNAGGQEGLTNKQHFCSWSNNSKPARTIWRRSKSSTTTCASTCKSNSRTCVLSHCRTRISRKSTMPRKLPRPRLSPRAAMAAASKP